MSPVTVPDELLPERTDFEVIAPDELTCTPAQRGLAIWRLLRASRRFPARSDLKPRDITDIMPNMSIVMVIDGGRDFENRFVGDAVVRSHDVPINHRRFSDVAKDMPALMYGLLPLFRRVVDSGEPLAYRGMTGHDMIHVVYTDFEGVLLPFGTSDEAVDHILYVGVCGRNLLPRR